MIEFHGNGKITSYPASDYLAHERRARMKPSVIPKSIFAKPAVIYDDFIRISSERHRVNPKIVAAIIHCESSGNANAQSSKGAQGLMQLMPATAERFGAENAFDPEENIEAGTRYLKFLLDRYNNNIRLAVAAYNAGEGAVDKYGGIPPYPETILYVKKIESLLDLQ